MLSSYHNELYKAVKIRLTTTPVLCSDTMRTTYCLNLNLNALFHFLLVTEALKCNYNIYENSFTIYTVDHLPFCFLFEKDVFLRV